MNNLIGRYKLISHGVYNSLGAFQATSSFLKGELIYSSENFLSVQIFFKNEIECGRDLLTYSGKYKVVSDDEIEHHIEICSQSKRDHAVEKRNFKLEHNILNLSILYDDGSKFEARWQKLETISSN